MCSSTFYDTANMSRHGSTLCSPTEEKILCRSPFRSGRRSLVCVRLSNKGKVGVQRGRKTAGCPSFLPPRRVPRRSRRPQTANPPAEVQRKTLRPSGANPLTPFVSPAQPVQEIYTKRAAAPMQQLFSMQNLNRTGSKPKFPRRYARSPR